MPKMLYSHGQRLRPGVPLCLSQLQNREKLYLFTLGPALLEGTLVA
jgi:hypothetical protein